MDRLFLVLHTPLALSHSSLQETTLGNVHFYSRNLHWLQSFWAIPGWSVTIWGWIGAIAPYRRGVICVMLPVLCLFVCLCLVLCCRMSWWTSGECSRGCPRMGFLSKQRNACSMHSQSRFWVTSSHPRGCAWVPSMLGLWWIGQPQIPVRPWKGFWGSPISTGVLFANPAN